MKFQPRIALIGNGPTAAAHAIALKAAGVRVTHCSARENKETLENFAKIHSIENIWGVSTDLIKAHEEWDGLIIAASVSALPKLLGSALQTGKPILIEKPVSSSSDYLSRFKEKSPDNVMVGYNRRFYSTVDETKKFLDSTSRRNFCYMQLPETINFFAEPSIAYKQVYNNSCHGVDLMRYLFGNLKIKNVEVLKNDGVDNGRYAILESNNKDICFLSLNWNSPANFSVFIENGQDKIALQTFEDYQSFSGMKILEATEKYPARKYCPQEIQKFDVFTHQKDPIKPGFGEQALEFLDLINGKPFKKAARLSDAFFTQSLIEEILNASP